MGPGPGSPADMEKRTFGSPQLLDAAYSYGSIILASAADHLAAYDNLVRMDAFSMAPLICLRGLLEAAALASWHLTRPSVQRNGLHATSRLGSVVSRCRRRSLRPKETRTVPAECWARSKTLSRLHSAWATPAFATRRADATRSGAADRPEPTCFGLSWIPAVSMHPCPRWRTVTRLPCSKSGSLRRGLLTGYDVRLTLRAEEHNVGSGSDVVVEREPSGRSPVSYAVTG